MSDDSHGTCLDDSLYMAQRTYIEDLKNVENLKLPSDCYSLDVAKYLWMEHHVKLNTKVNGIYEKACKEYREETPPDYLKNILHKFMEFSTDVFKSCSTENIIKLLQVVPNLFHMTNLQCSKDSSAAACYMVELKKIVDALAEIHQPKYEENLRKQFHDLIKLQISLTFGKNSLDKSRFNFEKYHAQKGYSDSIKLLTKLVRKQEIDYIKTFTICMPDSLTLQNTDGCGDSVTGRRKCMAKAVFEHLHVYIQTKYNPRETRSSRIVLFGENYVEKLKELRNQETYNLVQAQNFNLLELVAHLKKDLKIQLGQGFGGLRQYFTNMGEFNSKIAAADIGFITGFLKKYETSVDELVKGVGKQIKEIIEAAFRVSIADTAEKGAKLIIEIASAYNPLKWLTDGTSVAAVLDRTAELMQSVATTVRAKALKEALTNLVEKTRISRTKLKANEEFMKNVSKLIKTVQNGLFSYEEFNKHKNSFLQSYNSYSPKKSRPEIEEMEAYWETVVEEACTVIENSDSAISGGFKAKIYKDGLCLNAPIAIRKMTVTFDEIYDFQFQLMDALAAYMRSMTAKETAKEIGTAFVNIAKEKEQNQDVEEDLKLAAMYSYIIYNLQQWKIVDEYCDYLEYVEGGVFPIECKGLKTSISQLLTRPRKTCIMKSSGVINVPTKPSHTNDKAYVDLDDLLAGNEITFQIPDTKWLLDRQIIRQADKDSKVYVQEVSMFLPVNSKLKREVTVHAEFVGKNPLTPNGEQGYLIVPQKIFTVEYEEGREYRACHTKRLENVYNICAERKLPDICLLLENPICNEKENYDAFPSIFSTWKMRVMGYKDYTMPKVTTDLYLRATIRYCTMSTNKEGKKALKREKISSDDLDWCCDENSYFSLKDKSCQLCPANSKPKLNGYYCAK